MHCKGGFIKKKPLECNFRKRGTCIKKFIQKTLHLAFRFRNAILKGTASLSNTFWIYMDIIDCCSRSWQIILWQELKITYHFDTRFTFTNNVLINLN